MTIAPPPTNSAREIQRCVGVSRMDRHELDSVARAAGAVFVFGGISSMAPPPLAVLAESFADQASALRQYSRSPVSPHKPNRSVRRQHQEPASCHHSDGYGPPAQ